MTGNNKRFLGGRIVSEPDEKYLPKYHIRRLSTTKADRCLIIAIPAWVFDLSEIYIDQSLKETSDKLN